MVQMAGLKSDLSFYSQRCFLMLALQVAVTFSEELSDDVERLCTRSDSTCTYVGSSVIL